MYFFHLRWCITCANWRKELETYFEPRLNRIKWHNKKSWCWPNGPQDIAEVFILPGWPTANINLLDISTIFNVWNRCSSFDRNAVQVLAPLKENRNELIHNTKNMLLTNAKKKLFFQNIKNVINHKDIRPLIQNHANISQLVRDLEKGNKLFADDVQSSLREIGKSQAEIKDTIHILSLDIRNTNNVISRIQRDIEKLSFRVTCMFVLVFSLTLAIFQSYVPDCTKQSEIDLQQQLYPSVQNKDLLKLTSTNGNFKVSFC